MADTTPPPSETPDPSMALAAKKRRTLINWLRVTALLFAVFFFLSQYGMSKPRAKSAIIQSCIQNVPFSARWQNDLSKRALKDPDGQLVRQYCTCMWDEPLQKLNTEQIQSFAKLSPSEKLNLMGGEAAFTQRDTQCLNQLSSPQ